MGIAYPATLPGNSQDPGGQPARILCVYPNRFKGST